MLEAVTTADCSDMLACKGFPFALLLPQAFECLAVLEGTSAMAQAALQQNTRLRRDDTQNISAYFNKVGRSPLCLLMSAACAAASHAGQPHVNRACL